MSDKMYVLYDTQEGEILEADGGYVWSTEYLAKCKFNHFIRHPLWRAAGNSYFGAPAYSKQDRVVVMEASHIVLVD